MRLNRKWILAIALVVSMVSAISGTLAYLTSTDTETNTFTVGNVSIDLQEPSYTGDNQNLLPGVVIPKDPQIENTGRTDAWVWMEITLPTDLVKYIDWNKTDWQMTEVTRGTTTVVTMKRTSTLPAGVTSATAFTKVELPATLTSMPASIASKQSVDIVVNAYAIQNEGFADINAAIAAYGNNNVPEGVQAVSNVDDLKTALAAGEKVYLTADIDMPVNTTITVGTDTEMDLNGHTLFVENTRTATHNFMFDVNGGSLKVSNGTVSMIHTGNNMGWSGATTVFDVTGGGSLTLEGVVVENMGGTDMNFAVHLNNWGDATLTANNCVFDAPYCGVRVFNSGPNMNNVTINNSKMTGATRAFWVHNYVSADFGGKVYSGATAAYDEAAVAARLNFDIFGNGNTFEITGEAKSPIRYGFNGAVYYDINGNLVP